jgi:hypothetical protein
MSILVQNFAAVSNTCIGQLQITWTASPFFDMLAALSTLCALLLPYCGATYNTDVPSRLLRAVLLENSLMMGLMVEATPLSLHKLPGAMRPS